MQEDPGSSCNHVAAAVLEALGFFLLILAFPGVCLPQDLRSCQETTRQMGGVGGRHKACPPPPTKTPGPALLSLGISVSWVTSEVALRLRCQPPPAGPPTSPLQKRPRRAATRWRQTLSVAERRLQAGDLILQARALFCQGTGCKPIGALRGGRQGVCRTLRIGCHSSKPPPSPPSWRVPESFPHPSPGR